MIHLSTRSVLVAGRRSQEVTEPGFLVYVLFCNLCYLYSLVKMDCGVLFYLCFCVCSFSALTLLVGSFDP